MKNNNSQSVSVYGKPGCVQCKYTTRELDKLNVPYRYLDIEQNEAAHQEVKNLGFSSLPVVVTNSEKWAGFSPDRLRKINHG